MWAIDFYHDYFGIQNDLHLASGSLFKLVFFVLLKCLHNFLSTF